MTRIAREPGRYRLPDDAAELLGLYRELYQATRRPGLPPRRARPRVARLRRALPPDAGAHPRPVPSWEDAIAWDGEYLTTATPVLLDVGAAGKGYLVDLVSELLAEHGIPQHVVDASGDLLTRGVPLRVALEHPARPDEGDRRGRARGGPATPRSARAPRTGAPGATGCTTCSTP